MRQHLLEKHTLALGSHGALILLPVVLVMLNMATMSTDKDGVLATYILHGILE